MKRGFVSVIIIFVAALLYSCTETAKDQNNGGMISIEPQSLYLYAGKPLEAEGLKYSTEVVTVFKYKVTGVLNISNPSGDEKRVEFTNGCMFLLRLKEGDKIIWDQAAETLYTDDIIEMTLLPGETKKLTIDARFKLNTLSTSFKTTTIEIVLQMLPEITLTCPFEKEEKVE